MMMMMIGVETIAILLCKEISYNSFNNENTNKLITYIRGAFNKFPDF